MQGLAVYGLEPADALNARSARLSPLCRAVSQSVSRLVLHVRGGARSAVAQTLRSRTQVIPSLLAHRALAKKLGAHLNRLRCRRDEGVLLVVKVRADPHLPKVEHVHHWHQKGAMLTVDRKHPIARGEIAKRCAKLSYE